jgi:hypothetical protein
VPPDVKKETSVKEEVKDEPEVIPTPEEDESPWWFKEMVPRDATRHPDDP